MKKHESRIINGPKIGYTSTLAGLKWNVVQLLVAGHGAAQYAKRVFKVKANHLYRFRARNDRLLYSIEEVYSHKRLHSTLGYRPPNEFEEFQSFSNITTNPAGLS